MAGPLQAAGATSEPSEYATLSMDTQFTGMWTQRNPLRDADVPYLYRKFYSASRFDSIIDGINREISAKLTDIRRPGSSVFNSFAFPPTLSYYPFKFIQNGIEQIRVMADTAASVYDATVNGVGTVVATKSAGAGKTRFLGVGPTLYMADGVDLLKWIFSPLIWEATTSFTQGQFVVGSNGFLQLNIGGQT